MIIAATALGTVRAAAVGQTCVLATGCFDLLHSGHVTFLEESRAEGDLLIVGINSDRAVRELKGNGRPLVPERERATLVAALRAVDLVFLFDDVVADRWIATLGPDVLVMGEEAVGAYPSEVAVGAEVGARLRVVSRLSGHSTTALVADVLSRAAAMRTVGQSPVSLGAKGNAGRDRRHDR